MAGSLNHIIGEDGRFTMDLIENLGDAHGALAECFEIIHLLSEGNMQRVSVACVVLHYPDPWEDDGEGVPLAMVPGSGKVNPGAS